MINKTNGGQLTAREALEIIRRVFKDGEDIEIAHAIHTVYKNSDTWEEFEKITGISVEGEQSFEKFEKVSGDW
jgi:hypothetical protein